MRTRTFVASNISLNPDKSFPLSALWSIGEPFTCLRQPPWRDYWGYTRWVQAQPLEDGLLDSGYRSSRIYQSKSHMRSRDRDICQREKTSESRRNADLDWERRTVYPQLFGVSYSSLLVCPETAKYWQAGSSRLGEGPALASHAPRSA